MRDLVSGNLMAGAGWTGIGTFVFVAACTVSYSDGDDDDTSSPTVESSTLEIGEGQGFDLATLQLLNNVYSYSDLTNDAQLVWPSSWACADPHNLDQPAKVPAICGNVYHFNPFKQYDSFDAAYAELASTPDSALDKSYLFWSMETTDDVHWGMVVADNDQNAYVIWLAGLSSSYALQFEYAAIE